RARESRAGQVEDHRPIPSERERTHRSGLWREGRAVERALIEGCSPPPSYDDGRREFNADDADLEQQSRRLKRFLVHLRDCFFSLRHLRSHFLLRSWLALGLQPERTLAASLTRAGSR